MYLVITNNPNCTYCVTAKNTLENETNQKFIYEVIEDSDHFEKVLVLIENTFKVRPRTVPIIINTKEDVENGDWENSLEGAEFIGGSYELMMHIIENK